MNEEDEKKIAEAFQSKKIPLSAKITLVIAALGVAGSVSGFFILAQVGERPEPLSLLTAMFWWALLVAFVFKAQTRSMILGSIIGVVLGFLSWEAADIYAVFNQDEAWSVEKAMKNVNADLPKMLDDESRIDSVSISMEMKTYAFNYTFVNLDSAEIDTEFLSTNFQEAMPAICEDETLKIWLGANYEVQAIYHDKMGEVITEYSIRASDC